MATEEIKKQEEALEAQAEQPKAEEKSKKPFRGRDKAQKARSPRQQQQGDGPDVDIEERVVSVQRVAKVVKGGRRFSFSALIIAGDKKGKVGYGLGKAKEVPDAIRKASNLAKNNMISVSTEKGTIPHQILGEYDAGKILFKPAAEGTGIKASGACRSILELAGIRNVLTKSLRGNNPHNVVKATFMALKGLRTANEIANIRGLDSKTIRIR